MHALHACTGAPLFRQTNRSFLWHHANVAQVLDACLGAGVPLAGFVGGGYHADLEVLAGRHCWLHRAAAQLWADHGL